MLLYSTFLYSFNRPCSDFRVTGVQGSKNIHHFPHKFVSQFRWNLAYSLHLSVGSPSYSFYVSRLLFKGETPTYVISLKKISDGLYSNGYRPISFKLGIMIKTAKLYVLIPVSTALTFIQGRGCVRNEEKLWCSFSQNFLNRFRRKSVCFHCL